MAVSNSTDLNDLVGQIVYSDALSAAYSARVMRPLVNSIQVPQGAGSIVVPQFSGVAVASLTEGTAPNSTTLASTGQTLTPVERGVYVQVSKHVLYADPFSDLAPYGEQIGRALAEDEDSQILALADTFATTVGASGDVLGTAHLLSGIAALEAANAPGPYFAVFHPTCWAGLRSAVGDASVFASVGQKVVEGLGAGTTNLNGYVGAPYGVPCFISTQVDTTDATYQNLIFSQKAISYAYMQDIGVDVADNVPARAFDLMGWYAGHAAEQVDLYGCRILGGSSA